MNKEYKNSKILKPFEFSGDYRGDYGFEINGIKSQQGYISKSSAKSALNRKLDQMFSND